MAVESRSAYKAAVSANINDNNSGDITPEDVRTRMLNAADSTAFLQEDLGKGSSVSLASTLTLGDGLLFHITAGTGPVLDIDFATPWDGRYAILVADVAFSLTHNATTLLIPGGANLNLSAGDRLLLAQDAGDNILVLGHFRGDALVNAAALTGTVPDGSLPARLQSHSAPVTDANSATSSGFYDMASGGSNVPETSAYSLIVSALDANNLTQIAMAHASQRTWIRRRVGGTFGSWTIFGGQTPGRSFSGAADTLLATDAGGRVRSTGASAATITVPPNSSVPTAVDHFTTIMQYGTGQVTIAPGVGVTLRAAGGRLKTTGQYSYGFLDKLGTDEWGVGGDLAL